MQNEETEAELASGQRSSKKTSPIAKLQSKTI